MSRVVFTLVSLLLSATAFAQTPLSVAVDVNVQGREVLTNFVTFELRNSNATPATNASFSVTLPANLTFDPTGAFTACSGSVTIASTTLQLTNGTIPANGNCRVQAQVRASKAGEFTLTVPAGALTSANHPANTSSASGTFQMGYLPPTVSQSFSKTTAAPGEVVNLNLLVVNNDNGGFQVPFAINAQLPSGLKANGTSSATCQGHFGGTVTVAPDGQSFRWSGALQSGGGRECTASIAVSASAPGSYTHSFPPSVVESDKYVRPVATPASRTLTVAGGSAPTVSKSFSPSSIKTGDVSTVTITLANANGFAATGVAFTDNLPAGVVNAAAPNAQSTCGGSVTASAGGSSFSLSGGTIPANGNCTVKVDVTATTAGSKTNTIPAGGVTTSNAGANAGSGVATLLVTDTYVNVAKSFTPSEVNVSPGQTGSSRLTITLTNPTSTAATGVAFTDSYPLIRNAAVPNVQSTCGGSVTASPGSSSLSLSSGTVAANGSCTISVSIVADGGSYTNRIEAGDVTIANGKPNPSAASATFTVNVANNPPEIDKSFRPSAIRPGDTTTLRVTLRNPNPTTLNGVFFNDSYPSGIVNASSLALTNTCGGTATATAGGNSLALASGSIPPHGSCTVTVDVTAASAGTYNNTIAASEYGAANSTAPTERTTARLTVNQGAPLVILMRFEPPVIFRGGMSFLTIDVHNPNSSAVSDVLLDIRYPIGLTSPETPAATSTCGAINSLTIAGNTTCHITIPIIASDAGIYTVTLDDLSATLRVFSKQRSARK